MAIRVRRGNKEDFDPNKMLSGEFGIAVDSKEAFICFAPGDTKKMSTYEDMAKDIEEVTSEIQEQFTAEITQKISDAEDAITSATNATTAAEEVIADALTAISAANTAADTANTMAVHAQSAADDASAAADEANDVALLLEAYTLRIPKPAVTYYTDLGTTYPSPENGWTVTVTDEMVSYRYDGFIGQWINIGYISNVDIATNSTPGIVKGGGNVTISIDGELNVDLSEIEDNIDNINNVRNATITTSWVGATAPYTQEIALIGITDSDQPIIDIVPTTQAQIDEWNKISRITTDADKLIVTCFVDKPTVSIPILIKGV